MQSGRKQLQWQTLPTLLWGFVTTSSFVTVSLGAESYQPAKKPHLATPKDVDLVEHEEKVYLKSKILSLVDQQFNSFTSIKKLENRIEILTS